MGTACGLCLRRTIAHLGFCSGPRLLLELFRKGLVVEEGPRVIELVIPRALQVLHALQHSLEFLVTYQREDGGIDARAIGRVGCVVVAMDSLQRAGRFAGCYVGRSQSAS
jgi:hypothetical protein